MDDRSTRVCVQCGVEKPLAKFAKTGSAAGGRRVICTACRSRRYSPLPVPKERKTPQEILERDRNHRALRYRTDPAFRAAVLAKMKRYSQKPEAQKKTRVRKRLSEHKRRAAKQKTPQIERVTRDDWSRILENSNDRCHWCGTKMEGRATMDHLIPLSKGGSHRPSNIVAACHSCNSSKKDKLPHEWIGRLL